MKFSKLCIVVLATVLAFPVLAEVVDDAISLSKGGVTEDVIVTWAEHQNIRSLSTQDIVRLKEGNVPDRAISAMIKVAANNRDTSSERTVVESPRVEYTTPTTYYSDYPTYYSSYGYPYYYSYGYPRYYGGYYSSWRPSVGLSFNFGGGHHHRR
jgi:hypothetical protein